MLPACSSMVIMAANVAARRERTVRTVKTANKATPEGLFSTFLLIVFLYFLNRILP